LKPGVDGLLRTQEISWTKRIKTPSEVFKAGQQIDVKVLSINQDKRNIALSYRETTPNPWPQLVDSMPVGTEFEGTVFQVMPQGMIVTVGEGIDGFVPRSKMRKILQGNKIPYQTGDKLTVFIADIIPQEESLILAPKVDESEQVNESSHSAPRPPRQPRPESSQMKIPQAAGISLLDMLSEEQKQDLMDKR
jgi:small subunit ribosomal protein S1